MDNALLDSLLFRVETDEKHGLKRIKKKYRIGIFSFQTSLKKIIMPDIIFTCSIKLLPNGCFTKEVGK